MLIQEVPGWSYIGGGGRIRQARGRVFLMQDLKDMIYRDRNRPSIISFGVRVNDRSITTHCMAL